MLDSFVCFTRRRKKKKFYKQNPINFFVAIFFWVFSCRFCRWLTRVSACYFHRRWWRTGRLNERNVFFSWVRVDSDRMQLLHFYSVIRSSLEFSHEMCARVFFVVQLSTNAYRIRMCAFRHFSNIKITILRFQCRSLSFLLFLPSASFLRIFLLSHHFEWKK